ncbi:MAG: caspase family protein [Bacteroidales bacterium]|nr:caspase family protein [Bacteroidales bacterium]
MKKIILLILVIILAVPSVGQKVVSSVSESKYVNITKDPPKPPYLEIVSGSLQFADTDGNLKIDARETAYIRFDLSNSGIGPGLNLKAETRLVNDFNGLSYIKSIPLGVLDPGKSKKVEIPVTGSMDLTEGRVEFEIFIHETNGFNSDPVRIEVQTAAFRSPLIKVVDYKVSSQSGTTLERRKPFDVQILIQNVGQGFAEQVKVNLPLPANMFCLSDNTDHFVGNMEPGETRLIDYSFVTTANFTENTISFVFTLSEKFGRYAERRNITLNMNQQVSSEKLVVEGKTETQLEIMLASLTSSVDKNIPINATKAPNRLALIIGNENYASSGSLNAQINVDYARNDAGVFREYALNTLGVKDENLIFLLDASAGAMKREIDRVTELLKRMGSNSELIFYYAGHGFPDEATRIPYLIPVDIDAANLAYAIKLSDVYRKFSETGARRITIFLDACFSGGGRNQGLLAARAVRIKPEEAPVSGNMVVFAASSGDQSSLPYHKEKHGVFTFFLLKKLQETGGNITYGDLSEYLRREVGIISLRENSKAQDPEVMVSPAVHNTWMNWSLK